MFNEAVFFLHILAALLFLALAVRMGLAALSVYVALSGVLANLFVVKQIELFGLHATASDVFAVGGILGLNLIQELFGRESAKRTVRASLIALVLFACMSQIHLLYLPSSSDATQGAFDSILRAAPRIMAASIGVYAFVQRVDIFFFTLLKRVIGRFEVRVLLSLLLSQALDTALFSFFGLYGLVEGLLEIMLVSYAVKCAIIACSSPLAAFFKRIPKEANGVSV